LTPDGLTLSLIKPQALHPTAQDRRPSVELKFDVGTQSFGVVVAVSKKDKGLAFGHWVTALEHALGGHVVGAVVVRPQAQLRVGANAVALRRYTDLVTKGSLRPLALDSDRVTFETLECLRRVLNVAENKELLLDDSRALSVTECGRSILELGLLRNLKLLDAVFSGWPKVEVARPRPVAVPVAAPAAASSGTPPARQPATPPAPAPSSRAPVQPSAPAPPKNAWAEALLTRAAERLRAFGQPVTPQGVDVGPSFVRLRVAPRDRTDFNRVLRQAENLKLHLGLENRPLIANQAGYISIDVRRPDRQIVPLPPLLERRPPALDGQPAFPVGVDVSGQSHWLNLADPASCHLLIAGTTGSGKSEFLKSLLGGLAHGLGPDQLRFVLIDPKQVTFNFQGESSYLLDPVVHDADAALPLLEKCFDEMERRYGLLKMHNKEHVAELTGADAVPRWVLVFDEFADLMLDRASKKELETLLKRLGAKARAAGIHLVLGTQRTEAGVVTPLLRSNLPGRISLQVTGERDSNLILEEPDAAYLLGKGDLFWRQGGGLLHLQSPLASREELESLLRLS
jgi:DNA segregation ATPase FtsK/SpoIIIE-like protein